MAPEVNERRKHLIKTSRKAKNNLRQNRVKEKTGPAGNKKK
jgi:hypothetical protein